MWFEIRSMGKNSARWEESDANLCSTGASKPSAALTPMFSLVHLGIHLGLFAEYRSLSINLGNRKRKNRGRK